MYLYWYYWSIYMYPCIYMYPYRYYWCIYICIRASISIHTGTTICIRPYICIHAGTTGESICIRPSICIHTGTMVYLYVSVQVLVMHQYISVLVYWCNNGVTVINTIIYWSTPYTLIVHAALTFSIIYKLKNFKYVDQRLELKQRVLLNKD